MSLSSFVTTSYSLYAQANSLVEEKEQLVKLVGVAKTYFTTIEEHCLSSSQVTFFRRQPIINSIDKSLLAKIEQAKHELNNLSIT